MNGRRLCVSMHIAGWVDQDLIHGRMNCSFRCRRYGAPLHVSAVRAVYLARIAPAVLPRVLSAPVEVGRSLCR